LKLNGTHQLLVYADGINILGGCVNTPQKNTEALIGASKESGLAVNAEKTKRMVTFLDQHAGQNHMIKMCIKPLNGWNCTNIWEQP